MKRLLFLLLATVIVIGLAACGEGSETEEKEVSNVDASEKSDETTETAEAEEQDGNEVKEINQEIVDNENFKATLMSVQKIVDKEWDEERIEITFEVENKREDTIDVQAREVSADDKMIDESMLSMSQEVAGGKKADAVLTIENYDGDLPTMEKNLEMKLAVIDWESLENDEEYDVKIDFK